MFGINVSTTQGLLLSLAIALGFGIVTAIAYAVKNTYSKNMLVALIVLPVMITAVLTLINGNLNGGVGVGIAVAGAFGLLRFRSAPGTARDITFILISVASGLACANGAIGYGIIAVGAVLVIMTVFKFIPLGSNNTPMRKLKITVPENLDFSGYFDEVLKKYSLSFDLVNVKSTNMGSTFDLTYELTLRRGVNEKEFLDKIREINGNLPITCSKLIDKETL